MKSSTFSHGSIVCGTIVVADIEKSIALYCQALNYAVVERAEISQEIATAWSASNLAGQQFCLLQAAEHTSEDAGISYLRLLQSADDSPPYPHATTFGWCAFEISVRDVFALEKKLNQSAFNVIGPPKHLDNMNNVIPMQVVGPDQEVLYLNQVLASDEHTDLPVARYEVDQFFIAVLAAKDRSASVLELSKQLKLSDELSLSLRYSLINRAFDLDAETKHSLTLLQCDRLPVIEVDQYPKGAKARQVAENSLHKGNAIVSILVDSLQDLPNDLSLSSEPLDGLDGTLYKDSKIVVIQGSNGELIELLERPDTAA